MQNVKLKIKKRPLFCILYFASCALISASVSAIEIPLEGFGKTTSVAYVNMHKIFEAFPETEEARIELKRMIEEKKLDISEKKEEIARLKAEIAFLRKQKTAVTVSTSRAEPTSEADQETPPSAPDPEDSSQTEPSLTTPLTLPEGSPLDFIFSPPETSTETVSAEEETRFSTFSAETPEILPGIPSPVPNLEEKEAALSQKEADLEAFVGSAELEVRQMEEGKTMTLLAKIYQSLEEIAEKDGYSIIVDKDNILFGEVAIDITESVIWRLSSPEWLKKRR